MNNIRLMAIETSCTPDGIIRQDTYNIYEELYTLYTQSVVDTQEAQIREALIKLGWTPPPS